MNIPKAIQNFASELVDWRRDIHRHPELGFKESRTAKFVAQQLESFGCEVHTQIGGTGVVGVLRNGQGNRSIGLRADMDALPIHEENKFDHCSSHDGVMHACGHDGHTTMLLGAARYLAQTRQFDGIVHFIFQPAEEGLGGALAMIDDGLFDQFPCESIYGMHNWPSLATGQFGITSGPLLAGGALFDITVHGQGAHGAFPHHSKDPVLAASEIVVSLQRIVSRRFNPLEAGVVSVTMFKAGDAYNVIPKTSVVGGTARAFSREGLDVIEEEMQRIAKGVAVAHGVTAVCDFRVTFAPTINAEREARMIADAASELVGESNVERNHYLISGSEDFSFMLENRPGAFILIGNGEDASPVHTPTYDFNDEILPLGSALFARVIERELDSTSN
jgi:hippurate hydrolase